MLAMPHLWSERAARWSQITAPSFLLNALEQAIREHKLELAARQLFTWKRFLVEHAPRDWLLLKSVLHLARIAAADTEMSARMRELLQTDADSEFDFSKLALVSPSNVSVWEQSLYQALMQVEWTPPLNGVAAWDIVAYLSNRPHRVTSSVHLGALLVTDKGVSARLTLERLNEGSSAIYADSLSMLFVRWDDAFEQAIQHAIQYARAEGLWQPDNESDVRWKLWRQDGAPLQFLRGASLGGAFGMGLIKLLAQS